MKYKFNLQDLT